MSNSLIIVESPAKIKSIKRHLNNSYFVLASFGHICDLVPHKSSINTKSFNMKYQIIDDKILHIDIIEKKIKNIKTLYLATDPDREGEVISWHLYKILDEKKLLKNKIVYRIVFNEITGFAIKNAILKPRKLYKNLIYAQQTRRALDYLVGFNLSPLLWKKVRLGLSAGRVQSPALRMIVNREQEIKKFILKKTYSIFLVFNIDNYKIKFKLILLNGSNNINFLNKNIAKKNINEIGKIFKVRFIKKNIRKIKPKEPFRTATLQQEAIKTLGFNAHQTMVLAQQLYEGLDVGFGSVGLISYIRTDSISLSDKIMLDIKEFICFKYGKNMYCKRNFKSNVKNIQEAHEAIRPTFINIIPNDIKNKVTKHQYMLYDLIWKRTISSQFIEACISNIYIKVFCNKNIVFYSCGKKIISDGFLSFYNINDKYNKNLILYSLNINEELKCIDINISENINKPASRYSEASLIKQMERYGIGRPSTYTIIILTLKNRKYVVFENKKFKPTDIGIVVDKFLFNYFIKYVDYKFTSKLEDFLDYISRGDCNWFFLMRVFWRSFNQLLCIVDKKVSKNSFTQIKIYKKCNICDGDLFVKFGKIGKFIGCSNYPICKYTKDISDNNYYDKKCEKCGDKLVIKYSKYGKFLGCIKYPNCNFVESFYKLKVNIICPNCYEGSLLIKKYKKLFYGCNKYPLCNYILNDLPLDEVCFFCNYKLLVIKKIKEYKLKKYCPNELCNYVIYIKKNCFFYLYYLEKYFLKIL